MTEQYTGLVSSGQRRGQFTQTGAVGEQVSISQNAETFAYTEAFAIRVPHDCKQAAVVANAVEADHGQESAGISK